MGTVVAKVGRDVYRVCMRCEAAARRAQRRPEATAMGSHQHAGRGALSLRPVPPSLRSGQRTVSGKALLAVRSTFMRIVISALHFPWDDMVSCFDRAGREFGLDGVELSWHPALARPHCTAADMTWLRNARGQHGLNLSAHIWEDLPTLSLTSARDALLRWLERCQETGVTHVVLHGGTCVDRDEGIDRVGAVLHAVAPDCQAAGVTLCLENHYAFDYRDGHELFSEAWEFKRVLNPAIPELAFCFDTGHGHMTRTWEDLLRSLAPWLHYIHLADNHGEHDDHCAYGEGTVPWQAMFDLLADLGFDGTFCVEFPVRDDLKPFRRCLADLRRQFPGTSTMDIGKDVGP